MKCLVEKRSMLQVICHETVAVAQPVRKPGMHCCSVAGRRLRWGIGGDTPVWFLNHDVAGKESG